MVTNMTKLKYKGTSWPMRPQPLLFLLAGAVICLLLWEWTVPKHFSALVAPTKDIENLEILPISYTGSSTSFSVKGEQLEEVWNVLGQSTFTRKKAPQINAIEGRISYDLYFKIHGRSDSITMMISDSGTAAVKERNKWHIKQYEIHSPIDILSFLDGIAAAKQQ